MFAAYFSGPPCIVHYSTVRLVRVLDTFQEHGANDTAASASTMISVMRQFKVIDKANFRIRSLNGTGFFTFKTGIAGETGLMYSTNTIYVHHNFKRTPTAKKFNP